MIFDNLRLNIHYDTIYYGLISQGNYPEDKVHRFLNDIKEEVVKMYKNNVSFIFRQTNLERNCFDKFLSKKVPKIIENYNTSISSKNLNAAFQKVDEVKAIAARSIEGMQNNMAESQALLERSQNI
jgi:hypothetical protein